MREILFRAKRINNSEWIEGNLFIPDREDTPTQILIGTNGVRIAYDVIPETVGQYTGLTDKNGKKIFEGDIVEFDEYIYSVEWKQDRCGFGYGGRADRMLEIDGEHCEVIGNVYEGEFYDSESKKD